MNEPISWQIPPSTMRLLDVAPKDRAVALLIRHSVRGHLPPGDAGYTLPITSDGVRLAVDVGRHIGARLASLHASPLLRCQQTAESIGIGAGVHLPVRPDRLLGDHGIFVLDHEAAGQAWVDRGHEWMMSQLVGDGAPPLGMAAPAPAARFLVRHMLNRDLQRPGIHLFCTHDSLVTATAAQMLERQLTKDDWPWYLEAAAFWRDGEQVHVAYRDCRSVVSGGGQSTFTEHDVVEFARREIAATVGLNCRARFYLAGGAFKSLLTGRPPRDLDIWGATPADREELIRELVQRGARRLPDRPFGAAFETGGRTLEIPFKANTPTLESRLARFDIGLSAVGVEYSGDGHWRAVIHDLAFASVEQRSVRLLRPLVNWRFCLNTLGRLHRYSDELGYTIPPDEIAEIWRVFERQPSSTRLELVALLDDHAHGHLGIRAEAACRVQ